MHNFFSTTHHAVVAFFSWAFAQGRMGVSLTIIALIVSISGFVLSRFRLIKVRQIRAYGRIGVSDPQGSEYFEVSVLSFGAPVWDISAEVTITVPLKKKFMSPGFTRTYTLELGPTEENTNPLNSGQGITFQMKHPQGRQRVGGVDRGVGGFGVYFDEIAPAIPRRNICLCVYSGRGEKTRKLLKRIRSRHFHWELDCYLGHVFKVQPSWWRRILVRTEIWWMRRQSQKFQNWMKTAGS